MGRAGPGSMQGVRDAASGEQLRDEGEFSYPRMAMLP